jgi:hypothetical protein
MIGLANRVDHTGHIPDSYGRDVAKIGGITEKKRGQRRQPVVWNQIAHRGNILVQSADHGISGRAANSDTPRSRVRDRYGDGTGEVNSQEEKRSIAHGKVAQDIGTSPVFERDREDNEYWDAEKVVVVHGIPILEPSCFDMFSHAQNLLLEIIVTRNSCMQQKRHS